MKLRGGWALIRKSLLSYMADRYFFWTLSLGWMMGPLVYLFVWVTAAGEGRIGGFGRNDFIVYYVTLIFVNQLTYPTSHWVIGENIRNGKLSVSLLRPLPVIYEAIAADAAVKMVCMPFILVLTMALTLFFGFGADYGIHAADMLFFFLALLLAQILRFLFANLLALLAFWTQNIAALLQVNDTLVFLLAGQVAPTALLPPWLKLVADILPYRYMLGFPIEILSGTVSHGEILRGFLVQTTWLGLVWLIRSRVWKAGIKRYIAVGG